MIGWLLSFYGFAANVEQTPRALHGITILFSLLPAAFGLLSGLFILFYKLDEPTVKQIERDLAARKLTDLCVVGV
jgi:GPH family glycoside/pentoside/hexuronide:cation symporter